MYSKVNIFIAKYRHRGIFDRRVADHIGLPDAKIRVLRGVATEDGWAPHHAGDPWLIVEHGDFWPVMIELDDEDVFELAKAAE